MSPNIQITQNSIRSRQLQNNIIEIDEAQLSKTLVDARKLLEKLNSEHLISPLEEKKLDHRLNKENKEYSLNQTNQENIPRDEKFKAVSTMKSDNVMTEVMPIITSLVTSLDYTMKQIQQLKFKSFILSNSNGNQSRINVEQSLQRQEFERVRNHLLLEKETLLEKLNINENKVKKYKKRIVEKNKEINRLAKLLNENVMDVTQNDISSFEYSNSTISSTIRNNTIGENNSRDLSQPSKIENLSTKNPSDMLRTLGALASQVLNDDNIENKTFQPQINAKIEDENVTETEISFSTNNTTTLKRFNSIPILSESREKKNKPATQLPRMRSFNTVDGSIKD